MVRDWQIPDHVPEVCDPTAVNTVTRPHLQRDDSHRRHLARFQLQLRV